MGRVLAGDDEHGGENDAAAVDGGPDAERGGPRHRSNGPGGAAAGDGRRRRAIDRTASAARPAPLSLRGADTAARGDRHVWSARLHGGGASAGDGYSPRARRDARAGTAAS